MEKPNTSWLPNLNSEIMYEARGFELDAYIIALEGWRRGLTLRWHVKDDEHFKNMKTWYVDRPGKLFSLSSETKTHYFFRTRGDVVTNEAVEIGMDKARTKETLKKNGINVTEGKSFNVDVTIEEILSYASQISYPVVVKPVEGSFGRDVHLNIKDDQELTIAFNKLRDNPKIDSILIERQYNGNDHRLYVIDDQVVAAIERIPANIVGDGESTILELIEAKNELRKQNPRLISCLIKIDKELKTFIKDQGFKLSSILDKGERLYLTDKSNISIGGDSRDVLDNLSEKVKELSIKTIAAISGLNHAAIDLIISESGEATVIEINTTAQIGSLVFPMYGTPRDVPSAIIDYYFPETKNDPYKSPLFFDFYDLLEPLNNRVVTQTKVSIPLKGKIYGKRFIVSGDVLNVGYHRGLRKRAFEGKVSGYVKRREDDRIDVVVMGNDPDIINNFDQAILSDPERSSVEEIITEEWSEPVKVGFEIKADRKLQLLQLQQLQDENKQLDSDIQELSEKINKYHKSFSWRLTAPIRFIGLIVKVLKKLVHGK
ncbi:MAG: hypothetical protein GX972_05390 [Amphibacillus sp.]|nr:hypothetical protein [Amphibacillus sp.]